MSSNVALLLSIMFLLNGAALPSEVSRQITSQYFISGEDVVIVDNFEQFVKADCLPATGPLKILRRIKKYGSQGILKFHILIFPAPVFPPQRANAITSDRAAIFRGRKVSPWCGSDRIAWIKKVSIN